MTTQTGRVIELELPLPASELSPNTRVHWAKRARATALYRELCGLQAIATRGAWQAEHGSVWTPALWEPLAKAELDLVFTFCGGRRWDDDACVAAFKPARDSLIDAGLIVNDSAKRLRLGAVEVRQARHSKHRPGACPAGVRVILREVAA